MEKKYKILAVIPARGGSKSVPRKNIKLLAGKPLLSYMVKSALGSKLLTHVVLSSEDDEILKIAKKYGGKKLILSRRPKYLATDKAHSLNVAQHIARDLERKMKEQFDYIVMLQVTTPFTTSSDIDQALEKLIKTKADSVVSVYQVNNMHPLKMKKIVNDRLVQAIPNTKETIFRRQDLPPVYKRNGGIYAAKREVIMEQNLFFCGKVTRPYIMPYERSIDINHPVDFILAEVLVRHLLKK